MANTLAIRKNFSKDMVNFPTYEELFVNKEIKKEEKLTKKDIDKKIQDEFNAWARY